MSLHFLFPSEPAKPSVCDEMFVDQSVALQECGFSVSFCSDEVLLGSRHLQGLPTESLVVYRGWMLKGAEYRAMVNAIERCGSRAFVGETEYLNAHHLPNWYSLVSDLTPETRVFPGDADIKDALCSLNWGTYFVKDYVKSLKTKRGAIVCDPSEAPSLIEQMREYRGEIEGGICVRRVEIFMPESE